MKTSSEKPQSGLLHEPRTRLSLLEKSNLIEAIPWAYDLSFMQVRRLAGYFDVYEVAGETVLFNEGDKSAYLVLIARGQVNIVKNDSARRQRLITLLGPGNIVGEMSLLDGEPRSATAVTTAEATLLVMTAEKFDLLLKEWPRGGIIVVLKIAKLMSRYLRHTSGRLIENLRQ